MATSLDHIIDLSFEFHRSLRRRMHAGEKGQIGANFLQLQGLEYIAHHPGATMKELAKVLRITSPSATSFVNRLVRLKWVTRKGDDKNRRLVRLRMTTAGQRVLRQKHQSCMKIMRRVMRYLTPNEQKQLGTILQRLLASLEDFR